MNVIGVRRVKLSDPANPWPDSGFPSEWLDFTVDGITLTERFNGDGHPSELYPSARHTVENLRRLADLEQTPGDFSPKVHRTRLDRLFGRNGLPYAFDGPVYPDGRVALLYCPCGDLDCGSLTTELHVSAESITWRDMQWQVTYVSLNEYWGGPTDTFVFGRTA